MSRGINLTQAQLPIRNIAALLKVNLPSIKAFEFRFRDVHAYNMAASVSMGVQKDPFQEMYKNRWAARTEPLWVTFAAVKKDGPMSKSVVRMWVIRRLKTAFKESLRKKGYNYDGTRLEGCAAAKNIFGTVLFQPQEVAVRMKYPDLVGQTDLAVEYITQFKESVNIRKGGANKSRLEKAKGQKHKEKKARV